MAGAALHPRATLTLDYLCGVLERAGLITNEQRREAVAKGEVAQARLLRQRSTGPRKRGASVGDGVHPAEVVVSMGLGQGGDERYPLTERIVMQALAQHFGVPFVDLDPLKIDAKLAPQLLSRPFARRHGALIIAADDRTVTVAVSDPLDHSLVDDLQTHVRREPRFVLSRPTEIQRPTSISTASRRGRRRGAAGQRGRRARNPNGTSSLRVEEIEASDSHVIAAVEYLLHYALDQRASDVHIETRGASIRGAHAHRRRSSERLSSPRSCTPRSSRASRRSRASTSRRSGARRTAVTSAGAAIAAGRCASGRSPSPAKLVIRLFDPSTLLRDLPDIGLFEGQLQVADRFLGRPHGLILVTGPTGSGKTTTLYGALRALATPEVNVVTIEDPIEIVVETFNQVAVQPKIGFGFAEALRHVLRQDPDVIMVGEVRDAETASIALQSALTGHMVLATLHTNDAASAITRLLELDVDPFVLASTLVGVVAQRLVRTVCPTCRVETFLTPEQMTLLGLDMHELRAQGQSPELMVAFGEGCVQKCRSTGLLGRTGGFFVRSSRSTTRSGQAHHRGQVELEGDPRQAGPPRWPFDAARGRHQEAREGRDELRGSAARHDRGVIGPRPGILVLP